MKLILSRIKIIAIIAAVMTGIHILNSMLGGSLNGFGIRPRDSDGLVGIIASPWLHGNISHLLGNLFMFSMLSFLCLMKGARYFFTASALIIIMTGLFVWLFGRSNIHIGASGWIFGLWGLTIALGWFERSLQSIVVAVAVIFFQGGMISGIFPSESHISFEAHLFGAISGVVVAALLHKKKALFGLKDQRAF